MADQIINVFNKNIRIFSNRINNVDTSLVLPGNIVRYGNYINQNFASLLENFASVHDADDIREPLLGQIWFNNDEKNIEIFNTTWKPLANIFFADVETTPDVNTIAEINGHIAIDNNFLYTVKDNNFIKLDIVVSTEKIDEFFITETVFDEDTFEHDIARVAVENDNIMIINANVLSDDFGWRPFPHNNIKNFPFVKNGIHVSDTYSIYSKDIATKISESVTDFSIRNTDFTDSTNENYLPRLVNGDGDFTGKMVIDKNQVSDTFKNNIENAITDIIKSHSHTLLQTNIGTDSGKIPVVSSNSFLLKSLIPGWSETLQEIISIASGKQILQIDVVKDDQIFTPHPKTQKILGILLAANTDEYIEEWDDVKTDVQTHEITENYYETEYYTTAGYHSPARPLPPAVKPRPKPSSKLCLGITPTKETSYICSVSGLTYDPNSKKLYASNFQNPSRLFQIDTNTGKYIESSSIIVNGAIDENLSYGPGTSRLYSVSGGIAPYSRSNPMDCIHKSTGNVTKQQFTNISVHGFSFLRSVNGLTYDGLRYFYFIGS